MKKHLAFALGGPLLNLIFFSMMYNFCLHLLYTEEKLVFKKITDFWTSITQKLDFMDKH